MVENIFIAPQSSKKEDMTRGKQQQNKASVKPNTTHLSCPLAFIRNQEYFITMAKRLASNSKIHMGNAHLKGIRSIRGTHRCF